MLERKITTIHGHRLAYVDEGEGPVLLFIHGFCGSADYFEHVIPALTPEFRCIAPDLRGHGQSDAPPGPWTIDQIAEDIAHLVYELTENDIVMFGHSLGGYATLAFAEKYMTRLSGFGLIHSTAYPDSEEAKKGRLKAIETINQHGIRHFVNDLIPKLFAPVNLESKQSDIERVKQIGYQTSPEGAQAALTAMKDRPDRNHILKKADCPILLVAGEDDQLIDKSKTFSAEGNTIEQKLIENAGHMSMYENPSRFIEIARSFAHEAKRLQPR